VKICRQLFAGEMSDFHGRMFTVAGRRLANGGHRIPIVIAASRPNMLKLAGRQSDGVLISAATAPPFVKACLDQVGAGRKSCLVYTKLGALDPIRRPIGFVLRGAHHAENIRLGGAQLDQAALAAAYAAENWSEVDRLVSDDVVRRHTACGTPQQVRDKLDEYRAIGLDEIVLGGLDDASSIAAALKAVA
jgi:5,10-methylenetetrahydromethanopterin reductase